MIITLYKLARDGTTHYYTIHDRQPLLDSPYSLCASWRIGLGKERERLHRFQTLLEKDRTIRGLIAKRVNDGYKILYSFSRAGVTVGDDPAAQSSSAVPDPDVKSLHQQ